jgi:hypothetical protein
MYMDFSISKDRLVENEIAFRRANSEAVENLANLKKIAKSEGHEKIIGNTNTPLHFICECSDKLCTKRIVIKPSEYKKIHRRKNQFMLTPGHDYPEIEKIVKENNNYIIVEKFALSDKAAKHTS